MAGYSGTPLPKKLGLKTGHRVALLNAPPGFAAALGELPPALTFTDEGPVDVAVYFTKDRAAFAADLAGLRARLVPDGAVWIAWPKKASRVPTDMTEDVVRAVALPTGLVDNKVCAIDDVWSGLRLVIRRELR
jgi:hypothetical protein